MDKITKKEIRQNIRELREKQTQDDYISKSTAICERILSLDIFSDDMIKDKKVGLYFPHKGEADLSVIREYLVRCNAICFYPVTYPDEIIMEKYDPELSEQEQTTTGKFGVKEPVRKSTIMELLDIILMPGIAYDLSGNRIGFGKGYYDKYLSENYTEKAVMKIAPAFEIQIIDNVFHEPHDMPVDIIVTERRIIYSPTCTHAHTR